MTGNSIKLTRRRLLGSVVTVSAASAATGAGTIAFFSDTETSADNSVQAGTLDLTYGSSSTFTFSTALAPTQTTTDSVELVSSGSLSGSLDVDVSYTESDGSGNSVDESAQAVAQNLEVTIRYGGTDVTPSGVSTLHNLANNDDGSGESTPNDLINLGDPGSGGTSFEVEFTLRDVGNRFQSDGVSVDFTFHLNQDDGQ